MSDTPCTNSCERACRTCMTCLALPRGTIKSSMNACGVWWARYCLPSLITQAMNQRSRIEREGGKRTFLVGENSIRFDFPCNNWISSRRFNTRAKNINFVIYMYNLQYIYFFINQFFNQKHSKYSLLWIKY